MGILWVRQWQWRMSADGNVLVYHWMSCCRTVVPVTLARPLALRLWRPRPLLEPLTVSQGSFSQLKSTLTSLPVEATGLQPLPLTIPLHPLTRAQSLEKGRLHLSTCVCRLG